MASNYIFLETRSQKIPTCKIWAHFVHWVRFQELLLIQNQTLLSPFLIEILITFQIHEAKIFSLSTFCFRQNKIIFIKIFCKIVNLSFFNNFSCKYFEDKKVHHGVNVYLFQYSNVCKQQIYQVYQQYIKSILILSIQNKL